ncbi:FHA domain-containing protein [Variovorax sp. KK3]|uniref:FHA domain-containing protein n=1 Tax=Variovorax sp. KK3 TaxID=1855728 RepID=UPI00097BCD5B|nr:FHA domain-containing protein [Variovorax sp. KK3]
MSRLIILARHGSVRQVNIKGSLTSVGRDPQCDVHIDSLGVSRRHASIHWTGDRFVLTDLASFNGTFVNDQRIESHPLKNGDAITIGDCQLRFLYSSQPVPKDEALRLVTQVDGLHHAHAARERSDWATFFRRSAGRAPAGSQSGTVARYR